MELLLLLMLAAAAGLSAASSQVLPQFHFIYDPKTFSEAQKYCRENYRDLVTVSSLEHVYALNQMYTPHHDHRVWIGLYDDVTSWRWSSSNTLSNRTGEDQFRNWKSGEPNNYKRKEHCVRMRDSGGWNDVPCDSLLPSVCFTVTGPDVTFDFINTSMSWTEAQSYCRTHHTDLATVRSPEDNQRVKELIPAGTAVWIGLFRDAWKWSDGNKLSFTYWKKGQPNNVRGNQICGAAYFKENGQWHDINCDSKVDFICYSDPEEDKNGDEGETEEDILCGSE